MSKVITFSKVFPSYHPRRGEPTFFVEKVIKSIGVGNYNVNMEAYNDVSPKHHTIRAGHRWKVGDKFSPRVWSGQPYASKQITFAPDIKIKKIWDFAMVGDTFFINRKELHNNEWEYIEALVRNDGLTLNDFCKWFNELSFDGQIICWNENINY